jgi:hypothetical protein
MAVAIEEGDRGNCGEGKVWELVRDGGARLLMSKAFSLLGLMALPEANGANQPGVARREAGLRF